MKKALSARWVNMALGAWLFVSAFLWPHSTEQFTNSWIVGLAAAIVAVIAIRVDAARYVNVALGVWLFIAAFALPFGAIGTFWNDMLVGVVMFVVALAPSVPHLRRFHDRRRLAGAPH